jgi:hypothetical protein
MPKITMDSQLAALPAGNVGSKKSISVIAALMVEKMPRRSPPIEAHAIIPGKKKKKANRFPKRGQKARRNKLESAVTIKAAK